MNTRELSLAFKRLINEMGGPSKAAIILRELGYTTDATRLSHYGNPDRPQTAPLAIADMVQRLTGQSLISAQMTDAVEAELPESTLEQLAGIGAKESGEAVVATIQAASDGVITQTEADKGCREWDDVIANAEANKALLQMRATQSQVRAV